LLYRFFFFFSSRRRHTRFSRDWSSDVCSSDLVFELLLDSLLALRRENKEVLWSSMVKDTMRRKRPSFNEGYHGYRTFSELLEDRSEERRVGKEGRCRGSWCDCEERISDGRRRR